MDKSQIELLRTTAEETRNNYTHISYFPKKTAWAVSNSKRQDFWLKYCKMINDREEQMNTEGDNYKIPCYSLAEKIGPDSVPLFADLSLKFHNQTGDEEWQPFDASFVREIVRQYQNAIETLLDIKESNNNIEFICMVLQSPNYIIESPIKTMSGEMKTEELTVVDLRLQFPFCRIEPRYHNHIKQHVIKQLRHFNIISRLTSHPLGDWPDLIKQFNASDAVTMYGSIISADCTPFMEYQYCYSYLLDNILEPIYKNDDRDYYFGEKPDWEDCYDLEDEDGQDIFPLDNHLDISTGLVNIEDSGENRRYWLPIITSMHYYNQITLPREEAKNRSNTKAKYGSRSVSRIKVTGDILNNSRTERMSNLELCEIFLDMIKPDRFLKKNQWLEIGRALYTEARGDETGLDIWKTYTKIATEKMKNKPKFLTDEFMDTEYITFTDMAISVETLAWYAKQDSYDQYTKWHTEWYTETLKACAEEEATDWKLATGFKKIFWLNIKCTNTTARHFYIFANNKWEFYSNDSRIDIMLSSEYIKYFINLRHQASEVIVQTKDKSQRKENERVMDEYGKIISCLENGKRKSTIIKQIANQMYDRDFVSRLDRNPSIIGFGNVVIDTGGDKIEAREGKPQDYVNKSSNVLFNKNMNDNHPLVIELLDWLHKAYPVESLFRYFMKYSASILKGKNSDKIILIFVGVGNNSKSMIVKLFEALLGPYCVKVPVSAFTGKRKSGNANPELAQTVIARIVFLQEPDDDDSFKKGILKEITGGDSYFARFLHDNGGKMEVLHKLALICNQVPIVEGADEAIMERWHLLSHLGRWMKTGVPKSKEEQMLKRLFECDPHFEERIKRLAPAFLYLMYKWYPIYCEEGLIPPKEMTQATKEYWDNTDIYHQFIADCIIPSEEERSKISITEMHDEFKDWYKSAYSNFCKIDRSKFKTEMGSKTRLGKPIGNYWVNVKFNDEGGDAGENAKNILKKKENIVEKTSLKQKEVSKEGTIGTTKEHKNSSLIIKRKLKDESGDEDITPSKGGIPVE